MHIFYDPHHDSTTCLPGCIVDHRHPDDDGLYCRTESGWAPAGTGLRGEVGAIEVGTDRCRGEYPGDPIATPWRVVLAASGQTSSLTPGAARQLAFALLASADLVERSS